MYILTGNGTLACFNKKNGKKKWEIDLIDKYNVDANGYSIAGSPVIEKDLLILNVNIYGMVLNKKQTREILC